MNIKVMLLVIVATIFNIRGMEEPQKDLYALLKVEKNATQEEIQARFQKITQESMDISFFNLVYKLDEDEDKKTKEAYEILMNPVERFWYDQFGIEEIRKYRVLQQLQGDIPEPHSEITPQVFDYYNAASLCSKKELKKRLNKSEAEEKQSEEIKREQQINFAAKRDIRANLNSLVEKLYKEENARDLKNHLFEIQPFLIEGLKHLRELNTQKKYESEVVNMYLNYSTKLKILGAVEAAGEVIYQAFENYNNDIVLLNLLERTKTS